MTGARFKAENEVDEPGDWQTVADFESWWRANVRALNRLSVTDREEWERLTRIIENFNAYRNAGLIK